MEILTKCLIISFACLGLRIASSKGQLLYFLRIPYEWVKNKVEINGDHIITLPISIKSTHKFLLKRRIGLKFMEYPLKGVIGCITCMSGIYTILIDYLYYNNLDRNTILCIFIVAFMNTIIFQVYENLKKESCT